MAGTPPPQVRVRPRSRAARSWALAIALAALALLALASVAAVASSKQRAQAAVAHRIVKDAQAELARNVHEVPDGSNNSRDISRYRTATSGAMRGAPWCAYFASYIAKRAGVPLGWHGEGMGYVPYIRDWAHKTGRWRHTPKPGYLITFPEHVGVVEHVYSNHTLSAIEGNAGNAVRREYHRWSEATGYVRLADGGSIEAPSAPHPQSTSVPNQKLVARIRAYPDTTPAVGQTVDFSSQDSSGNVTKRDWDLNGDGKWDAHGALASHAYPAAGSYTVKLRVTDKAKHHSTATIRIDVHADRPPEAHLSVSSTRVHPGDEVTLDASGSTDPEGDVTGYAWDFTGNGEFQPGPAELRHSWSDPGTYTVRVRAIDSHGNVGETSRQVTVKPWDAPVANAECSSWVPSGGTVHCTSDDSRSRYSVDAHEWDTQDDGTYDLSGHDVDFKYSRPGTYTVRLRVTDEHGRTAEDTSRVTVDDAAPQAKITPPAARTLNAPLGFDASGSSDSDGTIAKYEWDSGSGWQAGAATFSPTFAFPGSYTVRLRVTDDSGKTATTSYTFTLSNQAPTARIGLPARPVTGTPVTFDGTGSADPDGTVTKYQWDLNGNGTYESSGARPAWTYSTAGVYTIHLKVTDALGAVSAVATAQVTVAAAGDTPPTAVLSLPTTGLVHGTPIRLSAAGTTDPDGTVTRYDWDVDGDGTVDATTSVNYLDWTYALPGAYAVTLTVTDNGYAQATASRVLAIR